MANGIRIIATNYALSHAVVDGRRTQDHIGSVRPRYRYIDNVPGPALRSQHGVLTDRLGWKGGDLRCHLFLFVAPYGDNIFPVLFGTTILSTPRFLHEDFLADLGVAHSVHGSFLLIVWKVLCRLAYLSRSIPPDLRYLLVVRLGSPAFTFDETSKISFHTKKQYSKLKLTKLIVIITLFWRQVRFSWFFN